MASLKDIALAARVSIRTVARALNEDGYVAPRTRARVLDAAARLGYQPNLAARALKMGRSFEIVAVLGSLDELLMEKLSAFEQKLRAAGFSLHIIFDAAINRGQGLTEDLIQLLASRATAAVALFPRYDGQPAQAIRQLAGHGFQVVAVDASLDSGDRVVIDRQQGVCEAIEYLARSGRRRIAFLGPVAGAHARTRLDGYRRAMRALRRKPILLPVAAAAPGGEYEQGRAGVELLRRLSPMPDAVQVHSDVMALGLLAGLHERGIKVPGDVAVIGFDNRQVASLCWPRLTTVAQPNREAGEAAAEILLQKIEDKGTIQEARSYCLPTRLVYRDSA